jgi:ABC-type branched-subunit amino acid transport system substrate-binding protein
MEADLFHFASKARSRVRSAAAVALTALALSPAAHADDILIGQSVALSGPDADIGRDMRDGALAVFARANAANPAHRIKLVTLDNANDRKRAAENTKALLDAGAIALFGYNSATNGVDAAKMAENAGMLFFAPFTGSPKIRTISSVYTIRASYREEAAKLVAAKHEVGADKAVILYYDDEVGHSNFETVAASFVDVGLPKPRGVAVKRGAALSKTEVEDVLKDSPHYVFATTQYGALRDLLRIAGQDGPPPSVVALSFVNPDELAESVGPLARGVIVSQVIPAPRMSNEVAMPVVHDCAEALREFNGAKLNYTALESCIAARTLVLALQHAGAHPTRDSVLRAMATLGHVDLGGYIMNFSSSNRQASNWVDLTMLSRGDRYVR